MIERWSPAAGRQEIKAALRQIGQAREDREIDPAWTALLLAALDRPRVAFAHYEDHLAELGAPLERPSETALEARAVMVNQRLFGQLGYRGDRASYDDVQNANLMRVIDRRKGLPVALTILYLHIARAQGWAAEPLRFPGHVLVRLEGKVGQRIIVDPFDEGCILDAADLRQMVKALGGAEAELTPGHTEPLTNRALLLRLQNNIKTRKRLAGAFEDALEVLESMILISPRQWELWRETAEIHLRLQNLRAAVLALENMRDLSDDPAVRAEADRGLAAIHARLN